MANRYLLDRLPPPGPASLTGELVHHVGTVLRAQPGTEIVLADGRGGQCRARVVRAGRRELEIAVAAHEQVPRPRPAVHVAFAPPRWTRAEWLFEHGTEVGVHVFHPLVTDRARPGAEGAAGRLERWRRLCRQAAGQCDRAWVPDVREPRPLAEFLADPDLPPERHLADPGGPGLGPALDAAAVLLVGPEGGFAPDEVAAAVAAGFQPRALGRHVLRTETAALVGAAVLYGMGKNDSSAKL